MAGSSTFCEVAAPTLIVTGERTLDRVVPVDATLTYLQHIVRSRHVTLERTGHLGTITRPDAFSAIVREFLERRVQQNPGHRASA